MAKKNGIDAKFYVGASLMTSADSAGVTAAGFVLDDKVQNITLSRGTQEGDVTDRTSNGNKLTQVVLKDQSVDLEFAYDETDTHQLKIEDAYDSRGTVALAFMSSAIAAPGSRGIAANWAVTKCDREENRDGIMMLKCTVKPNEFPYRIKIALADEGD